MDISKLVRNAQEIHACLLETDNKQLIARKPVKILVPKRYEEHRLAIVANEVRIVGIYCMIADDRFYAVSSATAMMQILPTTITIVSVDDEEYYEFFFEKGAVICPNLDLLKDDNLVYYVYDEHVAKGHIPWYFSYTDLGKLFVSATHHGGIVLSASNAALEMIAATISRDERDRTKYYRHRIKSIDEELKVPPAFIPFRSVIYGPTNTTARLMGAYFDDGVLSALVNPSEKTEGIETLLRK